MVNYRKYNFIPGVCYKLNDVKKYYRFIYSELVMESYISYKFHICDEQVDVAFRENRDEILYYLTEAESAVQVLYGKNLTKT